MFKQKRILAVIPARSGSRGLPGKNIRLFRGRPLICRAIAQARASKYCDAVVVSTDSAAIARIAEAAGARAPFIRPRKLSGPGAKMMDVIFHALKFLRHNGEDYDIILLLQATTPLRTAADIDAAIEMLFKSRAKAVVSVTPAEHHPFLFQVLKPAGRVGNLFPAVNLTGNRQDLPAAYRINGAVYAANAAYLHRQKSFFGPATYAYIMPAKRSVDIDTLLDFEFAQFLAARRGSKNA